jgi:hypothetical protein
MVLEAWLRTAYISLYPPPSYTHTPAFTLMPSGSTSTTLRDKIFLLYMKQIVWVNREDIGFHVPSLHCTLKKIICAPLLGCSLSTPIYCTISPMIFIQFGPQTPPRLKMKLRQTTALKNIIFI